MGKLAKKIFIATILGSFALFALLSIDRNVNAEPNYPYQIVNGDFETGDFTGWSNIGNAFCEAGITNMTTFWAQEYPFNKQGNYFFHGAECGGNGSTGTMRSSNFTVGGSGYASFLLGAALVHEETYVTFNRVSDGSEVVRIVNNKFVDPEYSNHLQRRYVDLTAYIGEDLYIEVVDNRSEGWGILNLDDFITYYPEAPQLDIETTISAYNLSVNGNTPNWNEIIGSASPNYRDVVKDGNHIIDWSYIIDDSNVDMTTPGTYQLEVEFTYFNATPGLEYYVENRLIDVIVHPISNQIVNGDFETGDFTGWSNIGNAFCEAGITDMTTFWAEEYPFNKQGNYHFHGAICGEDNVGTLRSTEFILEGSGYISFLMGAAPPDTDLIYVRVLDADTLTEVTKVTNTNFEDPHYSNNYIRYYIDLSEYLNDRLVIEVVDNNINTGGFRYVNVDDFVTYYENTPTLDIHDAFPANININGTEPNYAELITASPTLKNVVIDNIQSSVDTSTFGTYQVSYDVSYQGISYTVIRDVEVIRALSTVEVISYFDEGNQPSHTLTNVAYGTRLSFEGFAQNQGDYVFAFWILNDVIRKDLPADHEFIVTRNMELVAIFANKNETNPENAVVFIDTNGKVIDVQYVVTGEDAVDVSTEHLSKPGYTVNTIDKWNAPLTNITEDTVRILQYTKTSELTFDLNVIDGNGSLIDVAYNTIVTVTKDDSQTNPFMYWMVDGAIVSYNESYSFTMLQHVTITAVYGTDTVTPEGLILMSDNLNIRDGYNTYLMQFELPSNATLLEYGLISYDQEGSFDLDMPGIILYEGFNYLSTTKEFVMSVSANITNVKAYLVYEIDGTVFTVYSE